MHHIMIVYKYVVCRLSCFRKRIVIFSKINNYISLIIIQCMVHAIFDLIIKE